MALFLLFALLSWLTFTVVILVEKDSRNWRGQLVRRYKLGSSFMFGLGPLLTRILTVLMLSMIPTALFFVYLYQASDPRNQLYRWYDLATSQAFAQSILGGVFGALLAVWAVRIYHAKPNQTLTLSQKVEGAALVFLFVIGTTSVSVDELVRSTSIEAGPVRLKLATSSATGIGSSEQTQKLSIYLAKTPDGNGKSHDADNPTGEMGFTTIAALDRFMRRDAHYIESSLEDVPGEESARRHAQEILSAAKNYEDKLRSLTSCIRFLMTTTADNEYFRNQIIALKPRLRELHVLSLALRSSADDAQRNQFRERSRKTADMLVEDLLSLRDQIEFHVDQLNPGYLAISNRLSRLRDYDPANSGCLGGFPRYTSEELLGLESEKRPYVAMLYASILQLDRQELSAIEALEDWLTTFGTEVGAGDDAIVRQWMHIRVYSTQYWLFETLFRREQSQPQVIVDRHMELIARYIRALEQLKIVENNYDDIFFRNRLRIRERNFENDPDENGSCPEGIEDFEVQLNLALLSARTIFVRRSLEHARFGELYLPRAKELIEKIVDANFGCAKKVHPDEYVEILRAENLRVYALFTVAQIAARRPIGAFHNDWAARELRSAQNALLLARSKIDKYGNPRTTVKEAGLSRSLENNPSRRLWDELNARIDEIRLYLESFEKSGGR